jgi:tRNA threonylcarbamoyladenosine modification (KEOPS) complex  Pcc1 subunit
MTPEQLSEIAERAATADPVEMVARAIHGAVADECGGISGFAGNPARWPWDSQNEMKWQNGGKGTLAEHYRKLARAAIMAYDSRSHTQASRAAVELSDEEVEAAIRAYDQVAPQSSDDVYDAADLADMRAALSAFLSARKQGET